MDSRPAAPVTAKAKPPLLRIVLLPMETKDTSDEGSKQYATMRFPGSYKDAVDAALKAFVRHIPANAKPTDFEILCPTRNNEYKLVWATFDAADWDLVVEDAAGEMLGIRQKGVVGREGGQASSSESPALDEDPFVVGNVGLTYGTLREGTIKWTNVQVNDTYLSPQIKRPKSYLEAIETIKTVGVRPGFPSVDVLDSNLQFKFHKFTSTRNGKATTDCWVDLPEEAHQHGMIWRLFAPKPFEILGFTLQKRRNFAANTEGSTQNS